MLVGTRFRGMYSNKNRVQVFFSLVLFSICSWFSLNPLTIHPLDGISFLVTVLFEGIERALSLAGGVGFFISVLLNASFPIFLIFYFRRSGSPYLSWLTCYWLAYLLQNLTRFFHSGVYRLPAFLSFMASLFFLVMGLFGGIANSEDNFSPNEPQISNTITN
ncbi:hypothetical protein HYY75_09390 [bacterium]|nr:hypothetical protein [bacterium]